MHLSIVDLAAVPVGGGARDALLASVALAQDAERLGYRRYWVAEHHGMGGVIASSNPEVLITRIASATETIRVGSGAVLLNFASPFRVAETFSLLDALFPGRIDLGLGRAGGDPDVDLALRVDRGVLPVADGFDPIGALGGLGGLADWMAHEEKVSEVVARIDRTFALDRSEPIVLPATGWSTPEPWLLGSSITSAVLAARLGLRYCYAAFFNPGGAVAALRTYRSSFQPASTPGAGTEPYSMLAVNAVCADTGPEADRLRASAELFYRRLAENPFRPQPLVDPGAAIAALGATPQPIGTTGARPALLSGAPDQLHEVLAAMVDATGANELIVQDLIGTTADRHRSYELLAAGFASATPTPVHTSAIDVSPPRVAPDAVPAGADAATR